MYLLVKFTHECMSEYIRSCKLLTNEYIFSYKIFPSECRNILATQIGNEYPGIENIHKNKFLQQYI